MLLTRSPLIQPNKSQVFSVRLACVKHAASVRPEPGSNSPNKNTNVKAQKNQPENPVSNPNQKHSKTKNRHKKQTNTLSSSQTTPTQSSARDCIACFRKAFRAMFPRPELLASFAAVRRNKENNTQVARHRQIVRTEHPFIHFSAESSRNGRRTRAISAQNRAISCPRPHDLNESVLQRSLQGLPIRSSAGSRHPQAELMAETITVLSKVFTIH